MVTQTLAIGIIAVVDDRRGDADGAGRDLAIGDAKAGLADLPQAFQDIIGGVAETNRAQVGEIALDQRQQTRPRQ